MKERYEALYEKRLNGTASKKEIEESVFLFYKMHPDDLALRGLTPEQAYNKVWCELHQKGCSPTDHWK